MSKFLFIMGISGVGKTTIIHQLEGLDQRYQYIKPYTNRPIREGEFDKIHITPESACNLMEEQNYLFFNELYGNIYITPRDIVYELLDQGCFPVLDFPIQQIQIAKDIFGDRLYTVYVLPESFNQVKRVLSEGRDVDNRRVQSAEQELLEFRNGKYNNCDFVIVNHYCQSEQTALSIHERFITNIGTNAS